MKWLVKIWILTWSIMMGGSSMYGQCNTLDLEKEHERLKSYMLQALTTETFQLYDSIAEKIDVDFYKDCEIIQWIKFELAEAYEYQLDFSKALDIYMSYIENAEDNERWRLVASTYLSLARSLEPLGRQNHCRIYLEKARQIIEREGYEDLYSRYAVRWSSAHREPKYREKAIFYAKEAIKYGMKHNVQRSISDGYLMLNILSDGIDESLNYALESAQAYYNNKDFTGYTMQLTHAASMLLKHNKPDEALEKLHKASQGIKKIDKNNSFYNIACKQLYRVYAEVYNFLNQKDSVEYYSTKADDVEGYTFTKTSHKDISEREIKYAIRQETKKVEAAQKANLLLKTGALLLSLFLLGLFTQYRKIKTQKLAITKQGATIKSQNEELKDLTKKQSLILSEIHHRVKNNLQMIIGLITVHQSKLTDKNSIKALQELSEKVFSISLIHKQLYEAGDFDFMDIQHYYLSMVENYKLLQSTDINMKVDVACEGIILNLDTTIPLGIIVTELLNNSFKYASSKNKDLHISIAIENSKDTYRLTYKDNGPGYPEGLLKSRNNSIGTMMIASMTKQLNGSSKTFNENGAVFLLDFEEKNVATI